MKRTILAAAVATAPLLMLSAAAHAQLSISTATNTPVTTATAQSGSPGDIDITSAGSLGVLAPGVAVTLNSNNVVTNEGAIGFTDFNNSTGILVQGGNTGSVTNTGTITITESYAPTDSNLDGLIDGDFASGGNRYGIYVQGPGTFNGAISNLGPITVHGNASYGVYIGAPITGDFQMLSVTPATTTTAATIVDGTISVLGNGSIGLYVPGGAAGSLVGSGATGGIGGNVRLNGISATGVGAQAVEIDGAVGGSIDVSGVVSATGYRTTSRPANPTLAALYTAQEMQQGGAALTVGGAVGGGVIVSAAPLVLSVTNLDLDNNGVPDTLQGTGQVISYGAAPAIQIGVAGLQANLGTAGAQANGYGLVINGAVLGNGLFDTITTPNLPGPVSATAIQIGAAATATQPAATVKIVGGLLNNGGITAQAFQANATAIHILSGASVDSIVNNGTITASASQLNTATTGVTPLNVNAILIEQGASVPIIVNNSGITGNITGSGGVGGSVGAIIDRSGTVTSITNTGTINAELTQSLITNPLPGALTAIDVSAGTAPQTFTQSVSTTYAGTAVYNNTISYAVGQLVSENGIVYEALAASGVAGRPGDQPFALAPGWRNHPFDQRFSPFRFRGDHPHPECGHDRRLGHRSGRWRQHRDRERRRQHLSGRWLARSRRQHPDRQCRRRNLERHQSGHGPGQVGERGCDRGLVDRCGPGARRQHQVRGHRQFRVRVGRAGGVTFSSLQIMPSETYVAVQTAGAGTLSAGALGSSAPNLSPFLYSSTAAYVPAASGQPAEITVTAVQKTPTQLGFTNAEGAALPAVLADLPNLPNVQAAILAQTTQAGFKAVYDQLLPNQGQGLFDSLDKALQSVGAMTGTTPDAGTRVAGSSLWLQEVNERVDRAGLETQGSHAKLLGIVAGYERMGAMGGAAGLTLAYYNTEENEAAQQVGGNVVASMVEVGGYYRRAIGGLTFGARGGGGYSFFSGERRLIAGAATEAANSNWNGYFFDGHVGLAYEQKFLGRFYARPELSADYLRLQESSHKETGGDPGFDLNIAARTSTRFSGEAVMVLGTQFGKAQWLRSEVRGGFREVFSGDIGDTVASFSGGNPFSLAPDADRGGWATFGVSLKSGSQYSYIALEGDADFRPGEQRYDIRLAGRSIF